MGVLIGIHSLWRWVVLIVVLVAFVRGLIGWLRGGDWTRNDRTLAMLATTALDIQLVIGILVYGAGQYWKDGAFIAYIHPLIMIIAIAIAHIFSVRAPGRNPDRQAPHLGDRPVPDAVPGERGDSGVFVVARLGRLR